MVQENLVSPVRGRITLNPLIKVSIPIITYNHENYIQEAIEGVLKQKVNFNYELLIGDDCSTDGTREIINKYHRLYPEIIKPIFHAHNLGPKGLEGKNNFLSTYYACTGKYIALLDGDDYWTDPYKLQKQIDFLEANDDFVICFHDVKILNGTELFDNYITRIPESISTIVDLSKGNYILSPTPVFRNCIFAIPAWFNILNAGDYPLYLLLAEKGKLYFINECMSVYRIHEYGYYTNAEPTKLLRGNIVLLSTLAKQLKGDVVRNNLNYQLNGVVNALVSLLLEKDQIRDIASIVIRYPFRISKCNLNRLKKALNTRFMRLGRKLFEKLK